MSTDRQRMRLLRIGGWFFAHYRNRASQAGTFNTAKQLRKQGVPLEVAVTILARKAS